jgi:hypothetical protein
MMRSNIGTPLTLLAGALLACIAQIFVAACGITALALVNRGQSGQLVAQSHPALAGASTPSPAKSQSQLAAPSITQAERDYLNDVTTTQRMLTLRTKALNRAMGDFSIVNLTSDAWKRDIAAAIADISKATKGLRELKAPPRFSKIQATNVEIADAVDAATTAYLDAVEHPAIEKFAAAQKAFEKATDLADFQNSQIQDAGQ